MEINRLVRTSCRVSLSLYSFYSAQSHRYKILDSPCKAGARSTTAFWNKKHNTISCENRKEIIIISGHPILGSLSYVTYFRVGRYGSTNMSSSLPTWPSTRTTTHRTSVWHTNDRLPVNSDLLNVSVASWLLILPDPQQTLTIPPYVS